MHNHKLGVSTKTTRKISQQARELTGHGENLLPDKKIYTLDRIRAQSCVKSRGGRPGLPVPTSPDGLCGRKEILNEP